MEYYIPFPRVVQAAEKKKSAARRKPGVSRKDFCGFSIRTSLFRGRREPGGLLFLWHSCKKKFDFQKFS